MAAIPVSHTEMAEHKPWAWLARSMRKHSGSLRGSAGHGRLWFYRPQRWPRHDI